MSSERTCYVCRLERVCSRALPNMDVFLCSQCMSERVNSWDEIDNKSKAPWNELQLASLTAYQRSSTFIPFTCDAGHRVNTECSGLRCSLCNSNQVWTYDWTLDWSWRLLEPPDPSGVVAKRRPPTIE